MVFRITFPYRPARGLRKTGRGKSIRLYPLLPFRFRLGGNDTREWEALVDSGADAIILPKTFGVEYKLPRLGRDISSFGVGGNLDTYPTRVNIIIGRDGQMVDLGLVDARVMKKQNDLPILFGRKPLFEMYKVIFMERYRRFQLESY